jgi:hypothetical protein
MVGSPRRTHEEQGRFLRRDIKRCQCRSCHTDLSHLSLLFRQGSQFMAFRVRLAGRPSSWVSREGETGRGRTSCFAGAGLVIAGGRGTFRGLAG